ncbi:PIN domain-containing protein [Arthrobacter sp. KNU40]|uniref:PIN domain-containing protein n=1 Tax=Arthrobacter sp. KNU40 TaxID=3447965 RepID=UPI003F5E1CB8
MIRLFPGVTPQRAIGALNEAVRALENARGSATDGITLFNAYQAWAAEQMRQLLGIVLPDEVDRLVTTPWHWATFTIDLSQPGGTTRTLIDTLVNEAILRLQREASAIRDESARWLDGDAVAAVLDTNVLLSDAENLESIDWNAIIDIRNPTPILLAIPMAVVDELDRLKQDGKPWNPDGKKDEASSGRPSAKPELVRHRARKALRSLEAHLEDLQTARQLSSSVERVVPSPLWLTLIRQDLGHVPLAHTDSEIIDRALSVVPFVQSVHLVTSDTGMLFRARQAGLLAAHPRCKL